MKRFARSLTVAVTWTALAAASPARADTGSLFGFGARSAGLARADVATDDAGAAARTNAALASTPGLRARIGYGYGAFAFNFDGKDAGVQHASGMDLSVQYGVHAVRVVDIGLAMALHLPDSYLAGIGFRPATEPQFVLYEAPLQRTTFDVVGSIRLGSVAIGAGAAVGLSVGGNGTSFSLAQDAHGTQGGGSVDVSLPYRLSPIVGARLDLGRLSLGATFRGPMSLDLQLDNRAKVDIMDNPLNGSTIVKVSGTSGWDPAVITAGARLTFARGIAALGSLEYAVYSAAPPPVASVAIDVHLGTTPGLREVKFPAPRFRDTISPRVAIELRRPSHEEWKWAARVGYAVLPSPVPRQGGLTTYLDAARHQIAVGGGYRFGKVLGVELSADVAAQLHVLASRSEDKDSPSLPYAHFDVSGHALYASGTLEAAW